MHIVCSYLHQNAKLYSVISKLDEVMSYRIMCDHSVNFQFHFVSVAWIVDEWPSYLPQSTCHMRVAMLQQFHTVVFVRLGRGALW